MLERLLAFLIWPTAKTWAFVSTLPVAASFTNSINLGGIVVGALVLGFGALFTVRANVAKVWREDAEGWKARAEQLEKERDKQRELKHTAFSEIAALRLKTDQTVVLERMAKDHSELVERLSENQRVSLERASEMLAATEERLLRQLGTLTRAQADLAVVVERVVHRLEKLEQS